MGVGVIGGLAVSTVMSLFIVPATFSVVDDFQQWLSRIFKRGRGDVHEQHAPVPTAATSVPHTS
jgi:hypothetical protein